jgi:hypothetical protein
MEGATLAGVKGVDRVKYGGRTPPVTSIEAGISKNYSETNSGLTEVLSMAHIVQILN